MTEPTHDLSARSTATTKAEGRLKDDVMTSIKKKRKSVKKIIKNNKY